MSARKILGNVGSNALGYVVNVVVGLQLTPYVLDELGNAGWGVWTLIVGLVGYYGLFDAGIRSAVAHFISTYHARNEPRLVNRTLSTAMALLLGVAAIALGITWLAAETFPDLFRWMNELRIAQGNQALDTAAVGPEELRTAIWIMGAGFALGLPMALFGTILYSVERIGLQNAIGIGQVLLRAALTVWVLEQGHGIVGLASVAIGCNVLGWIAAIVAAYRVLPGLSLAFRNCARAGARELFSYGGFNVLVNVGDTVLLYTSGFVIMGMLHDAEAVAYYALPATLIQYFMQLVQAVTWAFTPWVTGRWATGRTDEVQGLLRKGTRSVGVLAALIAGGLVFLGEDFLRIWCKRDFVAGPLFGKSCDVLAILAIATLVRATQSTGRQVLFAMREVRYLGLLALAEAVANVALSVILIRRFGLVGVAFGTLVPVLVMQGFVQPRHLLRELEVAPGRFVADVLRATVPVLVVMGAIDSVLGERLAVTSWPRFLARGFVVTVPALVVGVLCATSRAERTGWRRRARSGASADGDLSPRPQQVGPSRDEGPGNVQPKSSAPPRRSIERTPGPSDPR